MENPIYEAVLKIIGECVGEENALSAGKLLLELQWKYAVDVSTTRELETIIRDLRRAGNVIASCGRGFFTPANAEEAHKYLNAFMRPRAVDIMVTIRAQRKAIFNKYGRQIRMEI